MNANPYAQDHPSVDAIYRKAADSWWVLRHELDPSGQALPFGRVVYFATSETEVQQWLGQRAANR